MALATGTVNPGILADVWEQITCLYDMDIPRPDTFNETYLYEGQLSQHHRLAQLAH